MKGCKSMSKAWKAEEYKEHGVKPCSSKWLKQEKLEGHKFKIGSNGWIKEERKETSHK